VAEISKTSLAPTWMHSDQPSEVGDFESPPRPLGDWMFAQEWLSQRRTFLHALGGHLDVGGSSHF